MALLALSQPQINAPSVPQKPVLVYSTATAPVSDAIARAKLQRILARPEFMEERSPTAWDRLRERIGRWITDFLRRIFDFAAHDTGASRFFLWLLLAAGTAMVGFALVRLWNREDRVKALPVFTGAVTLRHWEEWMLAARAASASGDFARAIQCAYWAGISRLQEIGSLPADPTRTPREYVRLLASHSRDGASGNSALASLTASLERFWYARLAATPDDFAACLTSLEALGCRVN